MKMGLLMKTRRKRSTAGFTLLEVLVVIVIITVLFAIAAPSWDALMNRQRVNVVRDQATQLIRQAQADARRTHTARIVVFDNSTGIPRAAVVPQTLDTNTGQTSGFIAAPTTLTNWQTLGNGDIKANVLDFSTLPVDSNNSKGGQLVFNSNGTVDPLSESAAPDLPDFGNPMFIINVTQANTSAETRRCVIVQTLLGAVRQAEGDKCPAPAS